MFNNYTGLLYEDTYSGESQNISWETTNAGIEIQYEGKVLCVLSEEGEQLVLNEDDDSGLIFVKQPESVRAKYDIWSYDFSGEYYKAYDESLVEYNEYEQMVKAKTGNYNVDQEHGGFTLSDESSSYCYGSFDTAVTVDIDRENLTMKLVEPSGYIRDEYDIAWCDKTHEYYFIDIVSDDYYFKYNVMNF